MPLTPEQTAIIGTLAGVLIASLFNLANNWMAKRSEERTKTRELVINAAIENWKVISDRLLTLSQQGSNVTFYPLDVFIVYMTRVIDTCLDPKISRENLLAKMNGAYDLLQALIADREKQEAKLEKPATHY